VAQFVPTAIVTGLVAPMTERFHGEWVGEFCFALFGMALAVWGVHLARK
jgi:hypothetical protein